MSLIRAAFSGNKERRSAFSQAIPAPGAESGGGYVSEDGALRIGTVMSCVRVLATDIGSLPFYAYSDQFNGGKSPLKPQPPIVRQPFGPDVTANEGFAQIALSMALRGNAYCLVAARDFYGMPTQLTILHPDSVRVTRDDSGRPVYRVAMEETPAQDIVHFRGLMTPGAAVGIDPVNYYRQSLGLAQDVQSFGSAFFRNGSSPSGIISIKGKGDKAEAKQIKQQWQASNSGVGNAHHVAVLFGDATWTQVTVTPEQAQFLETRRFLREEICGMFGVPLHRIMAIVDNTSQGGGKGLDSQDIGYATHTLRPYAQAIENKFTTMLRGAGTYARFRMKDLLRADTLTRSQTNMAGRTGGWLSVNEIRNDEDLPPIDGGDDYTAPLNSAHAGDANPGGEPAPDGSEDQ